MAFDNKHDKRYIMNMSVKDLISMQIYRNPCYLCPVSIGLLSQAFLEIRT
jgi:hypothetical protein